MKKTSEKPRSSNRRVIPRQVDRGCTPSSTPSTNLLRLRGHFAQLAATTPSSPIDTRLAPRHQRQTSFAPPASPPESTGPPWPLPQQIGLGCRRRPQSIGPRHSPRHGPRAGEILNLILDDTRNAKRGRHMPAVKKLWDHVSKQFVRGHIVVTADRLSRRYTAVAIRPVAARRILPRAQAQVSPPNRHRRRVDSRLRATLGPQSPRALRCVLPVQAGDGGLRKPGIYVVLRRFAQSVVATRRQAGPNHRRPRTGRLEASRPAVWMKRDRNWRWMRMATVEGRLKKIGAVRVVFSKRPRFRATS